MSQRGHIFERVIVAGGGIHIDAWAWKYHLVSDEIIYRKLK